VGEDQPALKRCRRGGYPRINVRYRTERRDGTNYNRTPADQIGRQCVKSGVGSENAEYSMTDAYVYRFKGLNGISNDGPDDNRRATLDTLKGRGDPVMESQTIVDQSELDTEGFFASNSSNESQSVDNVRAEIKSLELRSKSRDFEARDLAENSDGQRKYMLQLESRELVKQAKRLSNQLEEMGSPTPSRENQST
jgi:hypothetical protein